MYRPAAHTFTDAHGTVWQATGTGLLKNNVPVTGKDGLPIEAVTAIAGLKDGSLWLATGHGAILWTISFTPERRWFYFWGQRYLSDNEVLQIVAGDDQANPGAWIRTRTGISLIQFEPYTLEQKSEEFVARIRQRHNRYGYVSGAELLRAGDTASFRMAPDDNDGLWTSMYVAAECFRYAATHSQEALENAQTSLHALLRLVSITSIPGLPARSLMHKGDYRDPSGEWHWTPDGEWEWKGDTSSDELVGHFFAYWVAYHLLPDSNDRSAIRAAVAGIAGGLLEHNLTLVGYGGKVTTWGRYGPDYLKTVDSGERALDSLELLSHLRVAYQITGDAKFLDGYHRIGADLAYVHNVLHAEDDPRQEINYSDEELALLSFYPLMNAESDPGLHRQYEEALNGFWQHVSAEKNPLWNFIYAQGTHTEAYACRDAVQTLQQIPLSTVAWTVRNSQRSDLMVAPGLDRFAKAQALQALAPEERRTMKWNSNPFQLDGDDEGRSEDDGTFFLLPYWMGRYHQLLDCGR